MTKRLIIVRHGNTFTKDQTPTRVGGRTDLPLVETERAEAVAKWLERNALIPDTFYAAPLKRTYSTAKIIAATLGLSNTINIIDSFKEIDYGPDEDKCENDVVDRLGVYYSQRAGMTNLSEDEIKEYGKIALADWDHKAIVPAGWIVDIEEIKSSWKSFASNVNDGSTTLLCTSNGIIRFAPCILNESYDDFCLKNKIKVATGSISIFEFIDDKWICKRWNIQPLKETF